MKKNFNLLYLLLSFVYLELVFKGILGLRLIDLSTFFVCICACLFGVLLTFIIDCFKRKGKVIITSVLLFIFGVYFSAHTCLYKFYKFYFQLSALSLLDQVAAFASDGLGVIISNAPYIIAYMIPLVLYLVFFRRFVDDNRTNIKISLIVIIFSLIFYLPFSLDPYGYVNKAFQSNNMIQIVNKNGVISGMFYDTICSFTGINNSIVDEGDEIIDDSEVNYDYNIIDFDFDALSASTNSSSVVELNNYFSKKTGTKQNEYTSFFEGKNLIIFMAESFNGICITPELTPTLYKLAHNGFEFNNFYTPTIYSTIGGEFCELTSLYPDLDALYVFRQGKDSFPMGIANLFKEKGYSTYSYHDSSYSFQDRNVYLKSLGFENYNACGIGLEKKMTCNHWPASDLEMINVTFDDYINDDKFITFYASVSGHGPYVFSSSDNSVATKNKELVKEYYGEKLGNSNEANMLMAYVAGQIELDRALESLLNKLESAGKLDDTVIALVGDHHPYYLTERMSMDQYNKISTYERDGEIELYHSNFILYNSAMEKVTIDKVGSQLDVMPTIYNLFGLEYDSRLLMGTDLLSNSSSIAIMADDSWVTDYGRYYASKELFVPTNDTGLSDSYVQIINNKVKNIKKISLSMINRNYYKLIFDYKKN